MRSLPPRDVLVALCSACVLGVAGAVHAQVPNLPVVERRLDNGLRVLVQQDQRTPRVGVALQYHVGFRTTPQGFRGLPHIVEHLMYTGSQHAPEGAAAYFEPAGGTEMNGMTGQDATTYYVELPARELDLALWIESDRMAYLITALDEAKVARERSVVLQEWRERVSGRASGWLTEVVQKELYPVGHPYHLVGDDPEHVASIRLAHVQWFLQQYYVPNNATLAIVGDVDPAQAMASVERYFASIPRSLRPIPTPERAVVRFEGSRFVDFEAPTYMDTVMIMWPTPPYLEADDATLDVLAKLLDRRLESMVGGALQSAGAQQASHHLASEFSIVLSVEPGTDTAPYLAAIDGYLAQLQQQTLRADALPAYRAAAANWITRGYEGYDSRAMSLALSPEGQVVAPYYLASRYAAISAEDIRRVAATWLPLDRRLIVHSRSVPDAPMGGRVAAPVVVGGGR
ncbi:MAG: insulinase family protein [Myxococcales bacterium]|nr:insulinase family protein [Myxococcales bacterium]MCB9626030.1 insulinase family protein [Sandaracinaceae bacterium]